MNITESLSVVEHRWLQGRLNNEHRSALRGTPRGTPLFFICYFPIFALVDKRKRADFAAAPSLCIFFFLLFLFLFSLSLLKREARNGALLRLTLRVVAPETRPRSKRNPCCIPCAARSREAHAYAHTLRRKQPSPRTRTFAAADAQR